MYILDSSFFFGGKPPVLDGELWTTDLVRDEVKDFSSRAQFTILADSGLKIGQASADDIRRVREAAAASGDLRVLSETDISVIALGLSLQGTVVSADYAVQNVCRHLSIPVHSLRSKTAKKKVWKSICSGCGAEIPAGYTECPVCGSPPVRRGTEKNRS